MTDSELFNQFVEGMQARYPDRNIKLIPSLWGGKLMSMMVYVDDDLKFNTLGYNLLYNVKRLCEVLEDELK